MKKLFAVIAGSLLLVISCKKSDVKSDENEEALSSASAPAQRCASIEVLEEQLAADPTLMERMQRIEEYTQYVIKNKSRFKLLADSVTIEIPVYFHVIWRAADENISNAQLQSQVDVLNEDFTNTNADRTKVPLHFQDEQTNVQIKFTWDSTKHLRRKYSSKKQWSTNDDMKFDSKGGSNVYDPPKHLNIWVVNRMMSYGSTILGYAQFPGGNWATDGIVLGHNFTGRVGKVSAPYHLGRTATHEVGHWMNLRHIWGDDGSGCSGSDEVSDTPNQGGYTTGCPGVGTIRTSCSNAPDGNMWMNYMDYTDDACMYMFSNGQRTRIRTVFETGGFRNVLGQ